MKVIVEELGNQYVMPDEEYAWLQRHLGEALEVGSVNFFTGKLCFISISVANEDFVSTTLFHNNHVKLKLIGTEELACIDTI